MLKLPSLSYTNLQIILTGAVNPNTLDLVGRLCRICGVSSPIIFRLNDRRELLSKVNRVLNLELDLESDVQNGYPGVICR